MKENKKTLPSRYVVIMSGVSLLGSTDIKIG